ncbi:MAG: glycosyltransferase family 9 protein [Campylobacterales bacterium]
MKYKNIGDILLSTSLINELKRIYPDSVIDYATNKFCKGVIVKNSAINHIYTEDFLSVVTLIFKRYDLIITLSEGDRTFYTALFSRARKKIGFSPKNKFFNFVLDTHIKRLFPLHTAQIDLQPLQLIGYMPKDAIVSSTWDDNDEYMIDSILKELNIDNFVVIHPVSRWMFKCWRDEYFAEIIDYIQGVKKTKVFITASDNHEERKKVKSIISHCKTEPIDLSGVFSLSQLGCLYSKADIFIGVDTAPMHIAASVNTPVVALFGSSEPAIWGPWDNLNQQGYAPKAEIQKTPLHTIIQDGFGEISINKNGEKYNTALFNITPKIVEQEIDFKL